MMSYAYYKAWTAHADAVSQTINYLHDILLLQYFFRVNRYKVYVLVASNSTPHKENYLHMYRHQVYSKRYPYIIQ